MDKWLTLDKVALELKETEREILNLASSGAIKLSWQPCDFIELYYIDYSDWDDSYGPKSVIRAGFFEIDLALCPDWKSPLNDIKLGGKGYGLVFNPIAPLVVMEVGPDGYIWSVTPPPELDTGKDLDLPTRQTLGVFQKELERYKNKLKRVESLPKVGINAQRKAAYKKYLDGTNQWYRLDEDNTGNDGLKDEVFEALKNQKANDGDDLIPRKSVMKKSWEGFKRENKDRQIK